MVVPRIGRTRLGHRTLKCALTIGTQSAQSIRASGTSAASTGRTRDRTRPMLQQRQKVLAKAPSTRDPKRTLGSPKSPNGTLWNVGSDHSGLMLANLITLAHFLSGAALAANPTPISEIAIYEVSHCGSGCRGTTGLVSPAGNTILKTDPRSAAERAKRRPL